MSRNKKIALIIGGVLVLMIGFFIALGLGVASMLKSSDAYKVSVEAIQEDETIRELTGGIAGYGLWPTGNINYTNGFGEAILEIEVQGVDESITVVTHLKKSFGGEWHIIEMTRYDDGMVVEVQE